MAGLSFVRTLAQGGAGVDSVREHHPHARYGAHHIFLRASPSKLLQLPMGRIGCLVEPLRFPGSQDVTPERSDRSGRVVVYPWRSGRKPRIGPLPQRLLQLLRRAPALSGDPRRVPRILSMTARVGQVSDRASSGFPRRRASPQPRGTSWLAPGRQPAPAQHPNCQRLRLEPVLQRTSGTPRYGHRSWVLTGTVWISRVAAAHLSWALLGPVGSWWTSVR